MANSKFSYVKLYEEEKIILLNCYFVLRIDGTGFKNFVKVHGYEKPNDINGIKLMNECALEIIRTYDEIDLCYGHSDEYSFLFRKNSCIWNRRYDKILSNIVSHFTSFFVLKWKEFFKKKLSFPPCFDGRITVYPGEKEIKDYFSWRQVDCHINTLYNECFWSIVLKWNFSEKDAHKFLMTTVSKDKHELLFTKFNINYNNLPEIFRRGTIIIRNKRYKEDLIKQREKGELKTEYKKDKEINKKKSEEKDEEGEKDKEDENVNFPARFIISHENLVSEQFWEKYNYILKGEKK